MKTLTARQSEILKLIQDFVEETGFPPTRSDIAKALRFKSINAAEEHLKAIEKKGHIKLTKGASRGIQLIKNLGLPLIGRVAAGQPILSEEHIHNRIQIEQALFKQPGRPYVGYNENGARIVKAVDHMLTNLTHNSSERISVR